MIAAIKSEYTKSGRQDSGMLIGMLINDMYSL